MVDGERDEVEEEEKQEENGAGRPTPLLTLRVSFIRRFNGLHVLYMVDALHESQMFFCCKLISLTQAGQDRPGRL